MHLGFALLTLAPGRVGGSETYVRGLLGEFAAGNGPERVTVLANREVERRYAPLAQGPVALHRVSSFPSGTSAVARAAAGIYARGLPRLAARDVPGGLDLLHYPVTVPVPATRRPWIVSLLDLQHHELPQLFSRAELVWRRWAYDAAAQGADLVVTISETARVQIVDRLGVAEDRVIAIPLGVDHERFDPAPTPADERLELPERFLVYPANWWPHKNHERLLRAFAEVGDPELELVLVGQAFGRESELAASPRVRHLGYVADEALPALYRRAVALVFPSLFEGFGLPVLEAMACGCPVIAGDHGAIREVADDAALLFDANSEDAIAAAIRRIATDAGLRATLRERGPQQAAQFTWTRTAERHLSCYREALGRGRGNPPP